MPGGEMANRPLHFFWILDCSGSMTLKGKIARLNFAIKESIPEMRDASLSNPTAQLLVRVITFATDAKWHIPTPVPVERFEWTDVTAEGVTDLGRALKLVAAQLEIPPMEDRALPPVLALISDGQPTDDYKSGLEALDATPWGRKAVRIAIAIEMDDDEGLSVLQEFLKHPELKPIQADNPKALASAIRWASTVVVKSASEQRKTATGGIDPALTQPVPQLASDDEDVW
jgi:uncharacterized protein YegL